MKRYYLGFIVFKDRQFESEHSAPADQTDFDIAIDMALDLAKEYGCIIILGEKSK